MPHTDWEKGLNANQLKLIAIAAMTLDHLTWTLFPGYSTEWYVILFHIIGRLTISVLASLLSLFRRQCLTRQA